VVGKLGDGLSSVRVEDSLFCLGGVSFFFSREMVEVEFFFFLSCSRSLVIALAGLPRPSAGNVRHGARSQDHRQSPARYLPTRTIFSRPAPAVTSRPI
jgi:hypothetical protein